MESIKKAAAILCSAAALAVFGAAAIPADAFETVDLRDRAGELKSNTVNIVADQVYAEPGETVDFRVLLSGNTGFTNSGIALIYDEALDVKTEGRDDPVVEAGFVTNSLMTEDSLNTAERIIAFSSSGMTNSTDDGTMFTAHLTVPADAADGMTYPMKLEIRHFQDERLAPVSNVTVDGWIKIRKPVVTTVTTPVTTTAPVTSTTVVTTTTVSAPVTTTTLPVTTVTTPPVTAPPVTEPPVTQPPVTEPPVTEPPATEPPVTAPPVTTSEPVATEPVTSKTKRSLDPNHGVTTAKGGTKDGAVQTGEAGAGAAAAGLLLALGTAAAMNKRRKDD